MCSALGGPSGSCFTPLASDCIFCRESYPCVSQALTMLMKSKKPPATNPIPVVLSSLGFLSICLPGLGHGKLPFKRAEMLLQGLVGGQDFPWSLTAKKVEICPEYEEKTSC